MELNVKEMLIGHPVRLRYVFRFSTSRVQHPESVAEHSYYVCLYSLLIADWYNDAVNSWESQHDSEESLDMVCVATLLRRAVIHDLEESRSGDFPRPFKHSDSDLKGILEQASHHAIEQVAEALLGKLSVSNRFPKQLVKVWDNAKDDSLEGRILEFADFLSVLSFMYEELGAGGNRSISNHVRDMDAYFGKFRGPDFEFIRPLVVQAGSMMLEIFPRKEQP